VNYSIIPLTRPAGAPSHGPFTACSVCARVAESGICQEVLGTPCTPERFNGLVPARPTFTAAGQQRIVTALSRAHRGSKVPVTIAVTATSTGWHIEAKRDGELFGFSAELRFCECDGTPCAKKRCGATRGRDGHCHGDMYGGKHIEHVRAFVAEVASAYAGPVTVAPIPDLRWSVNEAGRSVIVPLAVCA
jgi:hypothetical protein